MIKRFIPYLKVVNPHLIELWYYSNGEAVAFQGRFNGVRTSVDLINTSLPGFIIGYNPKIRNLVVYNFVMNKMPRGKHRLLTIDSLDRIVRHDHKISITEMYVAGFSNFFGSYKFKVPEKADTIWAFGGPK